MKKVTIICPIYNVEKVLFSCLQSIQAQTYKNFEVLCIDDGSTDSSGTILDAFCRADSRFIPIHQENQGVSVTRNRALAQVNGEYITFIDSDDTVDPHYLEVLVQGIESFDCEISVCGHDIIYPQWTFHVGKRKDVRLTQEDALKEILADRSIKNYAWGKCFKKECWQGILFPEDEIYEDTSTIYKTFFKAQHIYVSHQQLYHYLIRKGSLTQQVDPVVRKELKVAYQRQRDAIGQHYPHLKKYGLKNLWVANVLVAYDTIKKKVGA